MPAKTVKKTHKLFTLMVASFIGFSGLLLLVSGVIYYGVYSELAYKEIRTTKQELLDEASEKMTNYATGIRDTARFLVTNAMVHAYLSEPPGHVYDYVSHSRLLYEEFQKIAAVKEGIHSIELFTDWVVGFPQFQRQFMHPLAEAEAQGWAAGLERADGYWAASHMNPAFGDGEPMVSYVQRIVGERGQVLGIVKVNVREATLLGMLGGPADDDHYYAIMDAQGNRLAARLPADVHDRVAAGDDGAASGEIGTQWEVAGSRYSAILSEPKPQNWQLVQFISRDVLRQGGRQVGLLLSGLLIGLIVLSIPLALWVSKKLSAPIHAMVAGMHAVEKGDFDVRMDASSIREYMYLTTHFNRMVGRLKALVDRLNEEHRDRREAEMQLLHAQIKPHFLYNTLDLIHWRALDRGAPEISQMVQELSKLFRIGLGNDKWYVTVRDELIHARCYITIQEYRMNAPIRYEERVESDLFDALVPKIILQPFIENAFVHGFRHRGIQPEIIVQMASDEQDGLPILTVTIRDNGSGLPDDFDPDGSLGIGIRNVRDRIQLYCGPAYGLKAEPAAGGGTLVTLTLPLLFGEEALEQLTRSNPYEYHSLGG